ncbi:hypothetical protein EW146_g5119 [Bondarzewia mesenterica]|uniref:Calcium-transporting ATPase n=1 Tax=Bondarzewia mesenterica TaxID=1095465 RepID=A0A4S4LSE6_9AGAM|nr:hypothetical protein EW146_g5119 [Bondarzewia mesenterica]
MAPSDQEVPQIAITGSTEDFDFYPPHDGSIPSPVPDTLHQPSSPHANRARSPSEPGFLSLPTPILRVGRNSIDGPSSPTPSSSSDRSDSPFQPPPSPTLSAHSSTSVHWATSTHLRENRPEEHDGISSLGLLSPPARSHRRKGSNATLTSSLSGSETEPDHGAPSRRQHIHTSIPRRMQIRVPPSRSSSFVKKFHKFRRASRSPDGSEGDDADTDGDTSKKGKGKKKGKKRELERPTQLALEQDANSDPAPFAFKPYQLASLIDPKSIEVLEDLGGVEGLLRGLGTHRTQGLGAAKASAHAQSPPLDKLSSRKSKDLEEGPDGESLPNILITTPAGEMEGLRSVTSLGDVSNTVGGPELKSDAYAATMEVRRRVYGENVLPIRKSKSLLLLMWLALKDKVLILLSVAAIVSLALGFFQDFGTPRDPDEPPVDWVEGVAIIVAIAIVVTVGSVNDWQKERQFKTLNEKKEERSVKVIRGGVEQLVDVHEIVVGDVALLEPGEIVPCDGVFLSGHNVRCDEAGATGESDAIKKLSYEECIKLRDERLSEDSPDVSDTEQIGEEGADRGDAKKVRPSGMDLLGHKDCFVVSGSKVLEGIGSYVVIAVGTKSFNGRIMMALRTDAENTPLQLKLNDLAELIAKLGSLAGLLLFTALMIRTNNEKGIAFVQILIIAVTLVVVAVPEGLPLAVTLALAFATKRMTKEKLLVRVLGSCETMANASVVCTDKTGTLTQNEMTIVAGSIGVHAKFVRQFEDNKARSNVEDMNKASDRKHVQDFSLDQARLNQVLSPQLKDLFNSAIAVNSTAFENADAVTGQVTFVGSKTETALLKFAKELGWADYKEVRDSFEVVQMIPFSSERKAMGVVVKLGDSRWRLHIKGASEIVTANCTSHVVVHENTSEYAGKAIETDRIGPLEQDNMSRTITFYASQSLRTIGICYRDFEQWPPAGARFTAEDEVEYEDLAQDLVLIGIVGIEDPLREGVREAVANCLKAGVSVKMCTGDNVLTARSIAQQCGIYTAGGIVMEGPVFRQLPKDTMKTVVPRLQVLARSSPEDKRILVETLKDLGDVVGVTGDGTNDGPALKTAHVGFSMGIAGTEVAKEASDIILMDDNFSSIVKAIMWGRCVNDAVRKFLQFQISTNVTAVVITFVTAVASAKEASVLSAVQLLWINIIMDTFAALALATDPASPALLDRKPDKKTAPLFTVDMIKQIIGQSIYQIIIILVFHFLGSQILGFHDHSSKHDSVVQTLVFNIFVFAQIFNSINSRRLDNKLNIFEGILNNYYFMSITLIEIAVQVLIVFVGGAAFQVTRIGGREWGISLALGVVSIPLGALIRFIPNPPVERFLNKLHFRPFWRKKEELPTTRADAQPGLGFAIDRMRDNLGTFSTVRGGRMRSSSFVVKSRSARADHDAPKVVPELLTMLPTLMASHIVGSNWAPESRGSLSDPAGFDPSKSSAALWENKYEIHPDTDPNDPVFKILGTPKPSSRS